MNRDVLARIIDPELPEGLLEPCSSASRNGRALAAADRVNAFTALLDVPRERILLHAFHHAINSGDRLATDDVTQTIIKNVHLLSKDVIETMLRCLVKAQQEGFQGPFRAAAWVGVQEALKANA